MSQNRISPRAGFVNPSELPKGPNGRPLCRWCSKETKPPKRTFCSEACLAEHKIRTNPGFVREKLLERDKGFCRSCNLNAEKLGVVYLQLVGHLRWNYNYDDKRNWTPEEQKKFQDTKLALERKYPWLEGCNSTWQADHIQPVHKGGGECGLENYQILCTGCHQNKSAKEARDRAAIRQGLKAQAREE